MVREKGDQQLFVKIPTLFRCPISMDLMKSPVSLSTGVTYDRTSIQKWLSQGHNTCPATMQVLPSTDFVPNLTLRRLIHRWSSSDSPSPITTPQASALISDLSSSRRPAILPTLLGFARFSDDNRRFLANSNRFLTAAVETLRDTDDLESCQLILSILDLILSENAVKEELRRLILLHRNLDCLSAFVLVLQKGPSNSKAQSARILEAIATDDESKRVISDRQGLLHELYRLVTAEKNRPAVEAGLSTITAVAATRSAKKELIRLGIVRRIRMILASPEAARTTVEKAMSALESVAATTAEGRAAISEDEGCVEAVVGRLMKVSREATENGVAVIWSVCHVAKDRAAMERVRACNGLVKVLLVMQSGCAGCVGEMCADLVKVLRVGGSMPCLASYDTKTTHIMPY